MSFLESLKKRLISTLNLREGDPKSRGEMINLLNILDNIKDLDPKYGTYDMLNKLIANREELREMTQHLTELRNRNDWLEKNCKYGPDEPDEEETDEVDEREEDVHNDDDDDEDEIAALLLLAAEGGDGGGAIIRPPIPIIPGGFPGGFPAGLPVLHPGVIGPPPISASEPVPVAIPVRSPAPVPIDCVQAYKPNT